MYFDALTMEAIVNELKELLIGGRVQRVLLPHDWGIGLEIFAHGRRHQLLLSAQPQQPRLHLVSAKLTRGPERTTPLLLLLRKYVRGGRLEAIEQPPLERVVSLSITKFPGDSKDDDDEPSEPTRVELVFEIVGKSSNILLVSDDNLILDCVRHVQGDGERRSLLPQHPYELPPTQDKRDPRTATANGIRALLATGTANLARGLVAAYDGISPQVAREVAARVLGGANAPLASNSPFEEIAATLVRLTTGEERRPCIARDEYGQVIAFAPYWLEQHPQAEERPSTNAAAEEAYAAAEQVTGHSQRRAAIMSELVAAAERARRRVESLRSELVRAERLEQLRWEGEMIYGFLHQIEPGQQELEVEGRVIQLKPELSPVENAQSRFREYDKAKGALEGVPERLEEAEAQLAYIEETQALLELAESYEEIEQIAGEAQESGILRPPPGKRPKARRLGPLRIRLDDGTLIYVGRSANQNEEVTFRLGRPEDLWLHARNMPGAHVIIRVESGEPSAAAIERAAEFAAYYSKGRHDSAVEVDISRRKHVRRVPGGKPGLVTHRPERTVRVAPRAPEQQ